MSLLALFRNRDAKTPTESPPASVSKKRLRKKSFARLTERNIEAVQELSSPMGNHVSFESNPRSQRHPRASANIPELPCLPIYETLTLSMGPSKASCHGGSETSSTKVKEKPRPLSKCMPQNTSRVHFLPQQESPTFKLVPNIHPTLTPQPTPKSPVHDRASILADSYRSILPDFDAMEQIIESEDNLSLPKSPSEQCPHIPLYRPLTNQSVCRQSTVAKQVIVEVPSSPQHHSFIAQIDSVVEPQSAASSFTVVENSERSSEEETTAPAIPPQAPQRKVQAINQSRALQQSPSVTASSNPASPRRPRPPSPWFKVTKGDSTKSSLALQICTHMLTDELKKALFAQHDGVDEDSQAAKLQVLLLIEAYEGVMESCKEQLAQSEQEGSNVEVKHAREAVEILGHWLDSLYEIYGEAFGGDED
ncbi:hypothetical protein QC763_607650 [Podospora pseudopauciseta]|uniref:Mating-type switching protein swi10 n=1 Tax=Podospora pseudopauciseta TaxID=2093780 RepID=A0ABR0H5N1_9PEZI|nr:hypothetical protein QC763_607650 [Podospora pseudopauciseta]